MTKLDVFVNEHIEDGWHLVSRTDTGATLTAWQKPNHIKHFIGFILSLGLWAIPWLVIAIKGGKRVRVTATVSDDGSLRVTRGRD